MIELINYSLDYLYSHTRKNIKGFGLINPNDLNIEINNCSSEETMKRKVLYAFRLMNKNNKS